MPMRKMDINFLVEFAVSGEVQTRHAEKHPVVNGTAKAHAVNLQ